MRAKYFVIWNGGTTFDEKKELGEEFITFAQARKRANQYARLYSGDEIHIVKTQAIVCCSILPAKLINV